MGILQVGRLGLAKQYGQRAGTVLMKVALLFQGVVKVETWLLHELLAQNFLGFGDHFVGHENFVQFFRPISLFWIPGEHHG